MRHHRRSGAASAKLQFPAARARDGSDGRPLMNANGSRPFRNGFITGKMEEEEEEEEEVT